MLSLANKLKSHGGPYTLKEILMEKKEKKMLVDGKMEFKVKVCLDSFEDNESKKQTEFIAIRLDTSIFNDQDLPDFFNMVVKWPRDKSIFSYNARKHFRTAKDFDLSCVGFVYTYYNKKKRKDVKYFKFEIENPFDSKFRVELALKNVGDYILLLEIFKMHGIDLLVEDMPDVEQESMML